MLVYGKNVASEILKFRPDMVKKVYLQDSFSDETLLNLIEKLNLGVEKRANLGDMGLEKNNHQGIILDVTDYLYHDLSEIGDNTTFVVILDHLEDVHNFGAIIRSSVAAGVEYIIVPKTREVLVNATVMKTSSGALLKTKIIKVSNINNTIDRLKKLGFWVIGTDMEGEVYTELDYSGKIALVIGNENSGMSRLTKKSCDFVAKIPMENGINSLNASVAASIMMYEVVRNRK